MTQILELPTELLNAILLQAVLARGVKLGLRLRLVNKQFAIDVKRILFMSRLLDETKCHEPTFLKSYFTYQIFSDLKNTISPLRTIYSIAEILCEEAGRPEDYALRSCVESLCSLTIKEGHQLQYGDWSKVSPNDENYEYHLLVASAYLNHLPLLGTLLLKVDFRADRSQLFGHPAQAAALQGNNEALELILKTDWKKTSTCAFRGAIGNGHFRTLDLLLEPRWEFNNGLNHRFTISVCQGLKQTSSVAMFTRAFPLLVDYEADTPGKRLGFFLRCAVQCGHTMLALHLFHLGAQTSGHASQTFEDYNPLWVACKYGDETLVRLLLRKGANPNVPHDYPQSSPLQIATRRGRFRIVRALLDYGADMYKSSKDGPPAIVSATELEHLAIFCLLRERGAVLNARTSRIAFGRVAEAGLESMARMLLQEGAEPTNESIDRALERGNHRVAQILCEALSDRKDDIVKLWDVDWID